MSSAGVLSIVATPIGNLGDMTPRAVEVLRDADYVLAEDTRHSQRLFAHFGLQTKLVSCHDFNEAARIEQVLAWLQAGQRLALISDAGTPLISDPGYKLVAAVQAAGYPVQAIPGACAAIAALSISGLPTDRFYFEGFLPAKTVARQKRLAELQPLAVTLIFYESTHRITDMLSDVQQVYGETREVVLVKEITKSHEQVFRGEALTVLTWLQAVPERCKGEFVVLVSGNKTRAASEPVAKIEVTLETLLVQLSPLLPTKQVVALVQELTGLPKNQIYERVLACK